MKAIERYQRYEDEDFDAIILWIKSGTIKCGRYSHLVKINKNEEIKGKEIFKHAANNKDNSK